MIVLGIDPGVATIGFGVLDAQRGKNTLIQYGVITTPAGLPLSQRLRQIHADMEQLIRLGADVIGGCCGTEPSFIAALHQLRK